MAVRPPCLGVMQAAHLDPCPSRGALIQGNSGRRPRAGRLLTGALGPLRRATRVVGAPYSVWGAGR